MGRRKWYVASGAALVGAVLATVIGVHAQSLTPRQQKLNLSPFAMQAFNRSVAPATGNLPLPITGPEPHLGPSVEPVDQATIHKYTLTPVGFSDSYRWVVDAGSVTSDPADGVIVSWTLPPPNAVAPNAGPEVAHIVPNSGPLTITGYQGDSVVLFQNAEGVAGTYALATGAVTWPATSSSTGDTSAGPSAPPASNG